MENNDFNSANAKDLARFKEKTVHGTPMFPIARYHAYISEMFPFYPIHWHEEMEIIKVQSGKGSFCIDGQWYDAQQGDIFIIRPFVMHSINRYGDQDGETETLVFNLKMLGGAEADICTQKYFSPLLNDKHSVPCIVHPWDSWYHSFDQCVTSILMSNFDGYAAELGIKGNLYWMFYHLYSNRLIEVKDKEITDKRSHTVRMALEYIRKEYGNEISTVDIAAHCGYSEFYIMKLFKQFTGCSCVDYLNSYRLTVAGRQLRDSADDISTIAYDVGFNNVSYFNRQFKKQYGMTPSEFRRQWPAKQ